MKKIILPLTLAIFLTGCAMTKSSVISKTEKTERDQAFEKRAVESERDQTLEKQALELLEKAKASHFLTDKRIEIAKGLEYVKHLDSGVPKFLFCWGDHRVKNVYLHKKENGFYDTSILLLEYDNEMWSGRPTHNRPNLDSLIEYSVRGIVRGAFGYGFDYSGHYSVVTPGKFVGFGWGLSGSGSKVSVGLKDKIDKLMVVFYETKKIKEQYDEWGNLVKPEETFIKPTLMVSTTKEKVAKCNWEHFWRVSDELFRTLLEIKKIDGSWHKWFIGPEYKVLKYLKVD